MNDIKARKVSVWDLEYIFFSTYKKLRKGYSQISNNVVHRAVGRSEDPEVPVLFGGHNLPPLVEIGVTALPKSWGATTPPASPGTTLQYTDSYPVANTLYLYE